MTFHGRFVLTPRRLLVAFIIVAAIGLGVGGKVGLMDTVSTIIKALVQARGG